MFKGICRSALLACLVLGVSCISADAAPKFPRRNITLIVPSGPGGGCDLVARNFATYFEKYIGKTVVVSDRDGGGGTVGTSALVHSRPDGYTMGVTVIGSVLMQPLYGSTDYTKDDMRPLASITRVPSMIAVNKSCGIKNYEEFVAWAKAHPGELKISVAAAKGLPHLSVESFVRAAGIEVKVMPYKGANPAVAACLGGHTQAFVGGPSETLIHCQSGEMIPIAVFTDERLPEFPDMPTFKEKGLDISWSVWRGLAVPKDTPDDVCRILEEAIEKTVKDEGYIAGLKKVGEDYAYKNAADTKVMWNEEGAMLEQLIKDLGYYMQNKRK
ncbi:tripartite tricarboxylate transporter substrate binding protein [uncultured Mailhella sp.]|uniref:Bug family tripartite tricarboxylate transporter substrate binding protein n=1 Tax=uncultured Mailhella sp. TaxID=1981031 RepID=UPI0025FD5616|nr:tripartite tricarboxylate transporter substrate binding protein [uncultured Mailhella sp.]